MKDILVIDYTGLDWPSRGIRQNEGYVLCELAKRSSLDHIVVSTGYMDNKDSSFVEERMRGFIDQNVYTKHLRDIKVICPGQKESWRSFDFEKNWFTDDFLRSVLSQYEHIILNIHSVDPRQLDIKDRLGSLDKDRFRLNYSLYSPRLITRLTDRTDKDYEEMFKMMDLCSFFYDPSKGSFDIPESKRIVIPLGVDEKVFSPSQKEGKDLVVASAWRFKSLACEPYQLYVLMNFLRSTTGTRAGMYIPDMDIQDEFMRQEHEFYDLHNRKRLFQITDREKWDGEINVFQKADVFLEPYKTAEVDLRMLQALMSGIPIIAPENDSCTHILDESNSILFPCRTYYPWFDSRVASKKEMYDNAMEALRSFDRSRYSAELIRKRVLDAGYTSDRMVSAIDSAHRALIRRE